MKKQFLLWLVPVLLLLVAVLAFAGGAPVAMCSSGGGSSSSGGSSCTGGWHLGWTDGVCSCGCHPPTLTPVEPGCPVKVVSDSYTLWEASDGTWQNAVEVTPHPAWPTDLVDQYDAKWIWSELDDNGYVALEDFGPVHFRRYFVLPPWAKVTNAQISCGADNAYVLYVNGQLIGKDVGPGLQDLATTGMTEGGPPHLWEHPETYQLPNDLLQPGLNVIDCYGVNWLTYYPKLDSTKETNSGIGESNPAAVIFALTAECQVHWYIRVTPRTLNNCSSGKYVMVRVYSPVDISNVDPSQVLLNDTLLPKRWQRPGGASNSRTLHLFYSRSEVQQLLENATPIECNLYRIWVTYDNFYGQDRIRVIH